MIKDIYKCNLCGIECKFTVSNNNTAYPTLCNRDKEITPEWQRVVLKKYTMDDVSCYTCKRTNKGKSCKYNNDYYKLFKGHLCDKWKGRKYGV